MTGTSLPYRPCAGIMVLNTENKVWMGHRLAGDGDEIRADDKRWQMPQGGIDKGEKPVDAAKRELWEETGIKNATLLDQTPDWLTYDLPQDLLGTALKGKWRGQKQMWFACRFHGHDSEINISHPPDGAPVEFDDWQWVDFDEVAERIVAFKRHVYLQVVERFSPLTKS
ncbi:MAG: RNA pyrophosphohydrolase [Hyphomicrobiales bacterium]|nr:MAG: RNA pyrophosphohydrolase [Hyphomicrobiales bacterium]